MKLLCKLGFHKDILINWYGFHYYRCRHCKSWEWDRLI